MAAKKKKAKKEVKKPAKKKPKVTKSSNVCEFC